MILVTGTSGFVGKHLLQALVSQYGMKEVLCLTSETASNCRSLLHNGYSFDKDFFSSNGYDSIETVIHAGAFIPKKAVEANDYNLCYSNIFCTKKLLDALPAATKKIIFVSSVDVYGQANMIDEETLIAPASLYGHSKYYCEKMILSWAAERKASAIILRVGHVYGPGEEQYQKIIPVTINKLLKGETPQIWGSGKETRSFIYIKDVVQAILASIQLTANSEVINVVSAKAISIRNLIHELIAISGKPCQPEMIESSVAGRDLAFDNFKMQKLLCAESVELSEGLRLEWEHMLKLHH